MNWTKQLTRENTLLDRSLRAIAYRDSIKEIGKASMPNILLVGQGRVTSLYYLPADYKKQQKFIIDEFKGRNINKMSRWMVGSLEQGYQWSKKLKNKKLSKKEFIDYYKNFNKHHAHARGVVLYGYWGEPLITAKLKRVLKKKVGKSKADNTLSYLSSSPNIRGPLAELYQTSPNLLKKKENLLKQLKLTRSENELVDILSWFTFFYEAGEWVADYLYKQFIDHLKRYINNQKIFEELMWYDPGSFSSFLQGRKLTQEELNERQKFWILIMIKGKWRLLIGQKAREYYQKNLEERVIKEQQVIKGTTACLGKVRGTVKIIVTQEDQGKMKKGDILVSPMTTPRLMIAVKKAGAIITDEGGMTAHAAIVSREFNIPCIVGAKIATKVLKDGDRVEVDATKGIVKKLS